ncbi:DUF1284 domain-containing protein [Roseibium sp. SCP14]|uniref:DUF1284 domain-containing protein n=1 Tax=Roseibium sp. SCP14 TaxID=3141375 RepID=UPI00333A4968
MTVSIRAHHLLCMLTYLGKGYTPAFVDNYNRVVNRLNAGENIALVNGPDEICKPMLEEPECHCFNQSIRDRDDQALADIGQNLGRCLKPGEVFLLTPKELEQLRNKFSRGSLRGACNGCEWYELCSEIAQNDFKGCRLRLPLQ